MRVFLDFEASSLAKRSYPIEVGWVFEDGEAEAYLIRPAPDWTDWDDKAEGIHHIPRDTLLTEGTPHDRVARRMVERLTGHDLLASAPSWDGKWLSALLRAAGLPRHALRLRDPDDAFAQHVRPLMERRLPPDRISPALAALLAEADGGCKAAPKHRALDDARCELARWQALLRAAARLCDARPFDTQLK